ncbi:MAG: hypothetical protein HOP07_07910 [Bacteriovoracaceae bacterium]|nr:hypothetical protein [Bacteriovoracaceae bacterium]
MLPNGWKEIEYGDLFSLTSGKTKPSDISATAELDKDIPVYGGNGILGYTDKPLVQNPNFIIGRVGEYCGTIRYVNSPSWITDNALYAKEMLEDIDLKFLTYKLEYFDLSKLRKKGGQPLVSQEPIYKAKDKIPTSKVEQQKIAKILSTWDEAIEKLGRLIQEKKKRQDELTYNLLRGVRRFPEFTKTSVTLKNGLQEGWEIKKLGDIAEIKGGKRIPKGYALKTEKTEYPYIRVTDFEAGSVSLKQILYMDKHIYEQIKNYTINEDDIYISVAGTLGLVGRIPKELSGANLTENANKITSIKIDKDYLLYFLQSSYIQKEIESIKTTNAQPKLALTRIRDFSIHIPSLVEQQKISKLISNSEKEIILLEKCRASRIKQKQGLMQILLTGKRRVHV